jgi:hypothetical protein
MNETAEARRARFGQKTSRDSPGLVRRRNGRNIHSNADRYPTKDESGNPAAPSPRSNQVS